ncbi:MAG: methylmalonyl Co-A mutase-associated GTPase MeaB [Gemmatimonadaceae bacterium]|nr:methylmalonyl Co-A mutase-associated GTPase MeaB [Chitinophagaceae bacterium]
MWQQLLNDIQTGQTRAIARAISLIENEAPGYEDFLKTITPHSKNNIIGLTGPPGAGKSTLVDALIGEITEAKKSVAVLCVDPSSPFHLGALLGDRIRMSEWYTNPSVYIRSLATRGSLGGLHPKILEIADLLAAAPFDYIIIETVGVGQSEIEIAGLADTTVVVVVPEAGDEVQTMKAGLMEIADIFVVNKSDRPGADAFVKNLRLMMGKAPIVKTNALEGEGIRELKIEIDKNLLVTEHKDRKAWLLTEKAWRLIQDKKMRSIDKKTLLETVKTEMRDGSPNLYRLIEKFT